MWKKVPEPTKKEWSSLLKSRRMKLYLDEDIEDYVAEIFRRERVNVKTARELGHRGKPDSFQAAFAFREKRLLVTRNGKDFWDDNDVPMTQIHGIIVIDADPADTVGYLTTLRNIVSFIPFADYHVGSKLRFSPFEMTIKEIDPRGQVTTRRFRLDRREPYEWVEHGEET